MDMATPRRTTAQLSLRLPVSARKQLDRSARLTGRTRSAIAAEAIEHYLSWRIPQQEALKHAIAQADQGDFADPAEVKALFDR